MDTTAQPAASFLSWDEFQKQFANLRGGSAAATKPDQAYAPINYDPAQIKRDMQDTQTKLTNAQTGLTGLRSSLYDTEYTKAGLGAVKDRIAELEANIASEKGVRDTSMAKTRKNPFYSAATITGETAEEEQQGNRTINNLIDERNGLAQQYQSSVGEINNKIDLQTKDKEQEIESLRYNLTRLDNQMSSYNQELKSQLTFNTEEERWESQFALNLAQVQDSLKPKTSVSEYTANGKLYRDVVDTQTGNIVSHKELGTASSGGLSESQQYSSRISQGLEPDATIRATAQRLLDEGTTDPTWKGYSGELAVRIEAEMNWLKAQKGDSGADAQPVEMDENALRKYVREQWSAGGSPEQVRDDLKSKSGNVVMKGTDKSAAQIIDDEYGIKTKGGITGWLGRLFRAGV